MRNRLAELSILAVGAVVLTALYLHFGLRLAEGHFLDRWNLAFDLDPGRLVEIFVLPDEQWKQSTLPPDVAVKHPLLKAMNGLCGLVPLCADDPKAYTAWVAALHGVVSSLLMIVCLRLLGLPLPEAVLAGAIFSLSAAQLFNAMIIESYVMAGTGIAAFLTVTVWTAARGPTRWRWLNLPLAVHLYGITTTNIVIGGLADLTTRLLPPRRPGWWKDFLGFWVLCGLAAVGATLLVWPQLPSILLDDPVRSVKEVYWAAPHGGEKSIAMVLKAFYPFSIVAPEFTSVSIDSPDPMLDFREMRYDLLGWLLVAAWLAALAVSVVVLARDRTLLRLLAPFLVVVAFNTVFHMFFQYRQSVFLYVTHVNFAVFVVSAVVLFRTCRLDRRRRLLCCAAALLFLIGLAANNLPLAGELARRFG